MIENILDGIEVRLGEDMQKNTHAQTQKNTQTNAPNPFLVILANFIGYNGFAFANVLRLPYFSIKKRAVKNREINRDKILQFPLNGQRLGKLKDMRIGNCSFAGSGCGAIATFNALSLSGIQPDMVDIVDFYEHKGLILNAGWGTNPVAVKNYLSGKGLSLKCFKGSESLRVCLQKDETAILLYWWVTAKECGAHYVSIEPCEQGIRIYNVFGDRDAAYEYENIRTFIENGTYKKAVYLIVMKR